jgi:hypothetical protein
MNNLISIDIDYFSGLTLAKLRKINKGSAPAPWTHCILVNKWVIDLWRTSIGLEGVSVSGFVSKLEKILENDDSLACYLMKLEFENT